MGVHSIESVQSILCFFTYLFESGLSPASISGYLAALKQSFVLYNLNGDVFHDKQISLLFKSMVINAPLKVQHRGVLDISLLKNIINACQYLDYPILYKSIFLLAFYTFLRISNFSPSSDAEFDTTRHLTRGDIVWGMPGAHLIVKWAKNLQERTKCHVIQIPIIKNKQLCPILAMQTYYRTYPLPYSAPMFIHPSTGKPLIQSKIRNALTTILKILNLPTSYITFHSFRKAGASFAFNHSVSLQNIQAHGAWKSQAVWTYLTQAHQGTVRVASAFQEHVL